MVNCLGPEIDNHRFPQPLEPFMPRCRYSLFLPFAFLFFVTTGGQAADGLAGKLEAVMNGPEYKQARWGILVVDARTGETVYSHNGERLFIPASTTKLYSCAAALGTLGPDFTFQTCIFRRGTLTDGRLKGDLILVASGDLTMGGRTDAAGKMAYTNHDHIYAGGNNDGELTKTDPLAGIKSLAEQVAKEIKQVDGDILVDDRLFTKNRGSGSGPDLLTPIVVNDNLIDVIVTPGAEVGQPATVTMRPATSFVQMDADVQTAGEGVRSQITVEPVGNQRFVVRGRIALKSKPVVKIYPVDEPAGFARALLIEALRHKGVKLSASLLQPPHNGFPDPTSYPTMPRVAAFKSPPFSELIKVTLKVSHNLYASTLPLLLAVHDGKRTLNDGLRLQGKFLRELGVEAGTISFAGGAGGANADAVTPRATIQLLQAMAKRPDYEVYKDGLPILGVDGTLADVVAADSPAKGKVRAKTGTLFWHDAMNDRSILRSKALAGTMTTAKGRELFVALFVNDVPLPRNVTPTREGKVLGKVCEIIYQEAP
jgi:D-alanyl-D-alanine carboxypeptidase/D-alanyl-D-alanine-endopeptidase (penicillin-binding protein 4)